MVDEISSLAEVDQKTIENSKQPTTLNDKLETNEQQDSISQIGDELTQKLLSEKNPHNLFSAFAQRVNEHKPDKPRGINIHVNVTSDTIQKPSQNLDDAQSNKAGADEGEDLEKADSQEAKNADQTPEDLEQEREAFTNAMLDLDYELREILNQQEQGKTIQNERVQELTQHIQKYPNGLKAMLDNPSTCEDVEKFLSLFQTADSTNNGELRATLDSLVIDNLNDTVEILSSTEDAIQFHEAALLFKKALEIAPYTHERTINTMIQNLNRRLQYGDNGIFTIPSYMQYIYQYGNENQRAEAKQFITDLLMDGDNGKKGIALDIITRMQYPAIKDGVLHEESTHLLNLALNSLGLDPKLMQQDWQKSTPQEEYEKRELSNFASIARLERQRTGAPKVLYEEFGISNFARYPDSVLLQQYDQRGNTDTPYGIVLYPKDDHNGGFYSQNKLLEDLSLQLQDKYMLRIYEAGSRMEVVKQLIRANRKYGGKHKISFAILGGHGTVKSIQFGPGDPVIDENGYVAAYRDRYGEHVYQDRGAITTGEISRGTISSRIINEFFEPRPSIILNSCSTGKAEGIAQAMSEIGAEVIGPDRDTSPKSMSVSFDDNNRVHFDVKYNDDARDQRYNKGELLS